MNENKQKGILQTNSKNGNASKGRRISWGEIKVKEYESDEEVRDKRNESLNLNNITIGGLANFNNDTIIEEASSIEASSRTSSLSNKSKLV
jgi:hypothetical protein